MTNTVNYGLPLYAGGDNADLTRLNAGLTTVDLLLGTIVNAKDPLFGAKGDGTTDDTAALQTFINYCINNNRRGLIPSGTYKITAALNFSYKPNWALVGEDRASVTIKQYTDNTPIFNLGSDTASNMHTYRIENITFDYANVQPSSNTNANCIVFSQMPYEGSFRSLQFTRGFYAFKVASGIVPPWGTSWDDLLFGGGMTGGAMDWSLAGASGTPNNHFGRMVMYCGNMVGPVYDIRGYNFTIGQLEFLNANLGPALLHLQAGSQAIIGGVKLEIGAYAAGQGGYLVQADVNAYVEIGDISVGGTTMTLNGISPAIISTQTGARAKIGYINCATSSVTGGTLYVATAASAPGIEIDTVNIGAGCALTWNSSTASSDYVKVKSWQNDKLSADKGNANYTVTLGDPNTAIFQTAFTAQRTITLPSDGDNLHNGLYYELVFNGAINGANTALIKAGATTLRTQTVDGVVLRYTWRRHTTAVLGWVLTRVTALDNPSVIGSSTWLKQIALSQGFILTGSETYDATYETMTASNITWPDGTTGAYATTSLDANGAVLGFTATYIGSTTKTVTVAIPRNAGSQITGTMTATVS